MNQADRVVLWLFALGFIFGGAIGFLLGVVLTLLLKS